MQQNIIDIVANLLSKMSVESDLVANVIGTFIFLFGELLLLFILISFLVALLQIYISKEKIQKVLTTPSKLLNSILGALLGSVTPFCSCSTIPLLLGLIKSGAPFSGMMSFLLTSPILNPAIIVLFLTFFGVGPTVGYAAFAFLFATIMGYFLDKWKFDRYIKMKKIMAGEVQTGCCDGNSAVESLCCDAPEPSSYDTFEGTFLQKNLKACKLALIDAVTLFESVLLFLLFGAFIGAFIYGAVPEDLLVQIAGEDNILAVPLAALIGIPMYIRTETMIPIASVLVGKGAALGTVVALIIGGAGASIPEVSLLASIFKKQLVITFVICVLTIAILTGFAFNIILY